MRICFIGNFSQVRSTEGYIADALASFAGVVVERVQENATRPHEFVHYLKANRPDVVLSSKFEFKELPFKKSPAVIKILCSILGDIRKLGIPVVSWVFDLMRPEFSKDRYEWAKAVSDYCTLFITTDTWGEGLYRHRCLRQGFPEPAPGAFRESFTTQHEACHLGELYGERKAWAAAITSRLGNRFGVVRGMFENRLHSLLGVVKLVLGPPWPNYPQYWSNRAYLVAGHGACLLAPMVLGMEEEGWKHMENMVGCPRSAEAQAEMAYDLLKQPEELQRIGDNAARFVWENHTYKHRAKVLLGWLQELQQGG